MLAFRTARLPMRPPKRIIKFIEITAEGSNAQWGGLCFGPNIYAIEWPEGRIDWKYREAMEWQIVIDLAGGIAEAISRGERRKREVFVFPPTIALAATISRAPLRFSLICAS